MPNSWIEQTEKGIRIIPADVYLDANNPVSTSIVSHAHGDHFNSGCKEIIGTLGTIALLKHRIRQPSGIDFITLPYQNTWEKSGVQFRLIPAGHIPGSAMVWMKYKNETALYTGDFNPRIHPMAEPLEYPEGPVDLLISESTFSSKTFAGKGSEEELNQFILRAPGNLPILFGVYALGKAQRMIHLIHSVDPGCSIFVHPFILKYNQVYESLGFEPGVVFPYRRKMIASEGRSYILMPPSEFRRMAASGRFYAAFVSGWDRRRASEGVQDWLPISDHPDSNQLKEFIARIAPKALMSVHGDSRTLQAWWSAS